MTTPMSYKEAITECMTQDQATMTSYFVLSKLLEKLGMGVLIPSFKNLTTCTPDGYTLLPKNALIGRLSDGKFTPSHGDQIQDDLPIDGHEHRYISSSMNGWTSYARYTAFEYELVRELFKGLMWYIVDSGYITSCIVDVRNLREMIPNDLLFALMDYSDKGELLSERYIVGLEDTNYNHYDCGLINRYSKFINGKVGEKFARLASCAV